MNDSEIVDLYLARDENAIRHTAEAYGKRLQALAFGIVEDRPTAEECENDTYAEAWRTIPPKEPRSHLYPYLACITRHIALNRCRDRHRQKRHAVLCELTAELEACIPATLSDPLEEQELARILNEFLASLKAEARSIFLRRYWFTDRISDIAKRYSLSESKVKTTLHRCRERLRAQLEKEDYSI